MNSRDQTYSSLLFPLPRIEIPSLTRYNGADRNQHSGFNAQGNQGQEEANAADINRVSPASSRDRTNRKVNAFPPLGSAHSVIKIVLGGEQMTRTSSLSSDLPPCVFRRTHVTGHVLSVTKASPCGLPSSFEPWGAGETLGRGSGYSSEA